MDSKIRQKIIEKKSQLLMEDYLSEAAFCNFLLMQDMGLDVVYHAGHELVQEYWGIMKKVLNTDNDRLVLMVSTELEKYLMTGTEELYRYLNDEIYEHLQRCGEEYPVQAAHFHMDAIYTLFRLNDPKAAECYIRNFYSAHQVIFGETSRLLCRNWAIIINSIMRTFYPEEAFEEFARCMPLISEVLKEDDILYHVCINLAADQVNQKRDVRYLQQAVKLCETWCKDIPIERKASKMIMIRGMTALIYRNMGEVDQAIEVFRNEIYATEYIPYKLYLLGQLASMLLEKQDFDTFSKLIKEGEEIIAHLLELNEYAAGFYNVCGISFIMRGQHSAALDYIDRAISIGGQVLGEDADEVIKFKYFKFCAIFEMGRMVEAQEQIDNLRKVVFENKEKYAQSLPLVVNGIIMANLETAFSSRNIKRLKDILQYNCYSYDLFSILLSKCNLYYLMMASDDIPDPDFEKYLREELAEFYRKYPQAEGYVQYLKAEYYRIMKESGSAPESAVPGGILDQIEVCLKKMCCTVNSMSYFHYYNVKLRNLLFKKKYHTAAGLLLSMWEKIILPLFRILGYFTEENGAGIFTIMYSYSSLFVSTVRQYPELRISKKDLYLHVLNIKYFEDLFYCNKLKFYEMVKQGNWLSESQIPMKKEELIIECYDYIRLDMKDMRNLFCVSVSNENEIYNRIYFAIQIASGIFSKYLVEIIEDVPYLELYNITYTLYNSCDREAAAKIEKMLADKLLAFLSNIKRIFFCCDGVILIPLSFIRIGAGQFLSEHFQIIYCNTAKDIKEDIGLPDLSKSIFWGMSEFDGDGKSKELGVVLRDLPCSELEVVMLGALTEGTAYMDMRKPKEWFSGLGVSLLHFSTHAVEDAETGAPMLIFEKDETGSYHYLRDEDISHMDWREVKLVIFSGCQTSEECWGKAGKNSLRLAAKKAGAAFSISSCNAVDEVANFFFMLCFYKNLMQYQKICKAFYETQKMVRTITKREILADQHFCDLGMDSCLKDFDDDFCPFAGNDDWASYMLQMN